jgi:uncharacterized protein (DUF885 family)
MPRAQSLSVATEQSREIDRIGTEIFSHWASMDLTTAALIGGITERIGSPLQSDSDHTASRASDWAARLDAIAPAVSDHTTELTRRYLRFEVDKLLQASDLHRFDLQITPYRIGFTLAEVHRHLKSFALASAPDLERYLTLVRQYHRFLANTLSNLQEQAAQEIIVPASALARCLAGIEGLASGVVRNVGVEPERLTRIPYAQQTLFLSHLEHCLDEIRGAFAHLLAYIADEYTRGAPSRMGLCQYVGGSRAYEKLIYHHTTFAMGADEVHRRGSELVREIEDNMAAVRADLRFSGSASEFLQQLQSNRRLYCEDATEMGDRYLELMSRCEAVMPKAFGALALPPYAVKRLPPEAEGGMTYGYYQPAGTGADSVGSYVYNASNLEQRSMIGAAALIYHELVPGHHLHLSAEMGNVRRPPYRRMPTITAFSEGWAEYASDLGFELGLYEDPYDRYGRYLMQAFTASRLVVDTGLNAFGWTEERASQYMRDHTAQSPTEIESEIPRYACSMPGQALAYAPGRIHIWEVRRAAEQRMGSRFELPDFHQVILDGGSLPLTDLSFAIDPWSSGREAVERTTGTEV